MWLHEKNVDIPLKIIELISEKLTDFVDFVSFFLQNLCMLEVLEQIRKNQI